MSQWWPPPSSGKVHFKTS